MRPISNCNQGFLVSFFFFFFYFVVCLERQAFDQCWPKTRGLLRRDCTFNIFKTDLRRTCFDDSPSLAVPVNPYFGWICWTCNNRTTFTYSVKSVSRSSLVIILLLVSKGGVGEGTWINFCLVCASNPYSVIVYSVANYRPHLSHFFRDPISLCIYLIKPFN